MWITGWSISVPSLAGLYGLWASTSTSGGWLLGKAEPEITGRITSLGHVPMLADHSLNPTANTKPGSWATATEVLSPQSKCIFYGSESMHQVRMYLCLSEMQTSRPDTISKPCSRPCEGAPEANQRITASVLVLFFPLRHWSKSLRNLGTYTCISTYSHLSLSLSLLYACTAVLLHPHTKIEATFHRRSSMKQILDSDPLSSAAKNLEGNCPSWTFGASATRTRTCSCFAPPIQSQAWVSLIPCLIRRCFRTRGSLAAKPTSKGMAGVHCCP